LVVVSTELLPEVLFFNWSFEDDELELVSLLLFKFCVKSSGTWNSLLCPFSNLEISREAVVVLPWLLALLKITYT